MTVDNVPVNRLGKIEFAAALRKGQGRALLHVLHYGLEDVEGLILEACLHNQVYDQQIESIRGDWLFSMFRSSPNLPLFREAILKALQTETDIKNISQLAHLAVEFAAQGDNEARTLFGEITYRLAADPAAIDWPFVDMLLELEGAAGFLNLSRIYGERLRNDTNDAVTDLRKQYQENPEFREVIKEYAQKEAAINAYREYLEKQEEKLVSGKQHIEEQKQQNHERVRKKYAVESILNDAQNEVGNYPGRYTTFGSHALPEELEQIYAALKLETKETVRTRLLWVFRRAKLPHLDAFLFDWAVGANDELRSAAIGALAQVSDERVHQLARMKTEAESLLGADHEVLGLFLENYEPADAALITKSLAGLQAVPEDAHELSYDLIELADKVQDHGLADSMLWVYENTPCGFCRYRAIKWLSAFGFFSDALRFECRFDANSDTKEFASETDMT